MSVSPETIATVVFIVGLYAILRVLRRILRKKPQDHAPRYKTPRHIQPNRPKLRWIVVDGSNVMFWDGNTPQIATLRKVVDHLRVRGLAPMVWFDANVGYKLFDKHTDAADLARLLDLPIKYVRLSPSGTPADQPLLEHARQLEAAVVSNDHFRDWYETFPELRQDGWLLRGKLRNGSVDLEIV